MSIPCPDDSLWLRLVDQDTNQSESEVLDSHLEECALCRQTVQGIAALTTWTDMALDGSEKAPDLPLRRPRFPRVTKKHLTWGVAAAILAVAAMPAPRRALAEMFTSIKPSHLAAVSLTPGQMSQITQKIMQHGKVGLSDYGSITTVRAPQSFSASSIPSLLQRAKLPNHWTNKFARAPYLGLTGQTTGTLVLRLNVSHINQLIRIEGGTHFFPQTLSNVPITLKIPTSTSVNLQKGSSQYNLTEMGIPSLQVPGNAHLTQTAAAIESLPFLPPQVQSALGALRSRLANTVVIPLQGGKTRHIQFDGHAAILNTQNGSVTIAWLGRHALYDLTYYGPKSSGSVLQEVSAWFR